ncbi:hypothetical protein COB55_05030 [Candidatus Wolfebacteria bacterium]|nr:MAG: hypothetical protein COB55_05030 [Candidatus Wolfebacteria bacterium]
MPQNKTNIPSKKITLQRPFTLPRTTRQDRQINDLLEQNDKRSFDSNSGGYIGGNNSSTDLLVPIVQEALAAVKENISEEDVTEIVYTKPNEPNFPKLIFIAAVMKDFSDVPAGLSKVLIPLNSIVSLILSAIVFFWMLGKLGFMNKKILRRFFLLLLETIPGLNFLPILSIFVFLAHNKEKKVVKIFLDVVERIENLRQVKKRA